jgi:hypothetical protein
MSGKNIIQILVTAETAEEVRCMMIHDTEEHVCCRSRMGANAVNLGGEKKNMKFGCQYTCIHNNTKSLSDIHTEEGRQNGDTRIKYF